MLKQHDKDLDAADQEKARKKAERRKKKKEEDDAWEVASVSCPDWQG